jgi:hypothetical protein
VNDFIFNILPAQGPTTPNYIPYLSEIDPLIIANIALVIVTLFYTIYTNKIVKDGRNRILQDNFTKEMDSIIGPLKSRIEHFQEYEPLYLQDIDIPHANTFRENIKKYKFLAPNNLRILIEDYLALLEKEDEELRKIRYEIRESAKQTHKTLKTATEENPIITKSGASNSESLAWSLVPESIDHLIRIAPIAEGNGTYLKDLEDMVKN